jgi:hypothetical protein
VKEGSKAKRVGLKLGDSIEMIDGKDTSMMTLKEANEALLHATKAIRSFKLGVVRYVMTLNLVNRKHALGVKRMIIYFCEHMYNNYQNLNKFLDIMIVNLPRTNHHLQKKL